MNALSFRSADAAKPTPVLEVKDLEIKLPTPSGLLHAVRGVSFDVSLGETVCIVGESGCGKSMTSLAIMGLLPHGAIRTSSSLAFEGTELKSLSESQLSDLRGNGIAMIFQEPMTSLNPVYTIGDQLAEPARRHLGMSKADAERRAIELLEKVGITGAERRMRQYPHQLSGGLRQRVMIAMALMCKPRLVIADEPTTALDVTIQAQILRLLKDLQEEMGMALLLISHDLGLVSRIADHVVIMYAGEVIESGPVEEIFETPAHPYTQGLLRCIPIPGKVKRGELLGSIPGMVPNLIGGIKGCSFRDRCPARFSACENTVPVKWVSDTHQFRCHLDDPEYRDVWEAKTKEAVV